MPHLYPFLAEPVFQEAVAHRGHRGWKTQKLFSLSFGFLFAMLLSLVPPQYTRTEHDLTVQIPTLTAAWEPGTTSARLEPYGTEKEMDPPEGMKADLLVAVKERGNRPNGSLIGHPIHHANLDDTILGKWGEPKMISAFPPRNAKVFNDIVAHFRQICSKGKDFKEKYEILGTLGQGNCGKVFKARHKILKIQFAVKRVKKHPNKHCWLRSEITAHLALDHPHIVRLIEYFDEEHYIYLVFEICDGPNLNDRIVNSVEPEGRLNEYEAAVALRHIIKSCLCCHSQYRGHYDITPENFMYTTNELATLKMIDLGLSSGFFTDRKHNVSGSTEYMAPEVWKGVYGPEGDVWSCGVVLFFMLSGTLLFKDVPRETMVNGTKVRDLLNKRLTDVVQRLKLSEDAEDLLIQMLQHDRHARPTVREILKHSFITRSYGFESVASYRDIFQRGGVPFNEALELQARLPEIFRAVAAEPKLKRLVRLAMAFIEDHNSSSPQRLCFRLFDRHGIGELSPGVMENDFRERRQSIPEDFRQLFEAIDLNGDGYISFKEFLAATLPSSSIFADDRLCQCVFSMFDRGEDGHIDDADLAEVFGLDRTLCQPILAEINPACSLNPKQLKELMCDIRRVDEDFLFNPLNLLDYPVIPENA